MTYITPDDVALEQEAKRYAARHPMPLGPRFIGTDILSRGRSFPLLSALPLPPYQPKLWTTTPVTGPKIPRGAQTASPYEQDYVDPQGAGFFLSGLGIDLSTQQSKIVFVGAFAACAYVWWMHRQKHR